MKVLDLFCGAGGLSWGFEKTGFTVEYAIDVDADILQCYAKAYPLAKVERRDITSYSDEEIAKRFSCIEVLIGGPPCQAFSTAGKRALDDPRALLVKEFDH